MALGPQKLTGLDYGIIRAGRNFRGSCSIYGVPQVHHHKDDAKIRGLRILEELLQVRSVRASTRKVFNSLCLDPDLDMVGFGPPPPVY